MLSDVMKMPVKDMVKKPFDGKVAVLFIKLLVSISLLVYLFKSTDFDQFFKTLSTAHPGFFLLSAILYIGCQYLSSFRWKVLLIAHNINVSTPRLFSFYLVGMFFNNFLPGSIGGDVVKGYDLYRHSNKGKESITTVFLERYTGVVALLLIGLVSLLFIYSLLEDPIIAILMLGVSLVFIVGTIIVTNRFVREMAINLISKLGVKKLGKLISGMYETFGKYRSHRDSFISAVLLSIIIQIMNVMVYITLSYALEITVPWGYFFLFFPLITIISMLPISLNGLGVREGINVYLFAQVGIVSPQALSLSLSWFFMVTAISLFGGLIFAFRK